MVDIEVHDYFSILWQIPTNIIIIVIIMVIIIIKIITCAVALETQYHNIPLMMERKHVCWYWGEIYKNFSL